MVPIYILLTYAGGKRFLDVDCYEEGITIFSSDTQLKMLSDSILN